MEDGATGDRWHVGGAPDDGIDYYDERRHLLMRPYDFKPGPVFTGDTGSLVSERGRRPFYGVEIEMGGDGDLALEPLAGIPSLYFKEDSTCRGEIVTHPGTVAAWRRGHVIPWAVWRQWRDSTESYPTDQTGLHIHISRKAFTMPHLYRFAQLFGQNVTQWERIGRRSHSEWGDLRVIPRQPEPLYRSAQKLESSNRYSAINFQPSTTVEVRFPKSTYRPATIVGTIELIDAAVAWTRHGVKRGSAPYLWSSYARHVANRNPRGELLWPFGQALLHRFSLGSGRAPQADELPNVYSGLDHDQEE